MIVDYELGVILVQCKTDQSVEWIINIDSLYDQCQFQNVVGPICSKLKG